MKTRYQLSNAIPMKSFWISRAKEDGDEEKRKALEVELNQFKTQLENKEYDRDGSLPLTRYQLKDYLHSVSDILDWPSSKQDMSSEDWDELVAIKAKLTDRLEKGEYDPEINERGNTVVRDYNDINRYHYDALLKSSDGWQQYDTKEDAWYFGIWINPKKREFFTYAEGDTTQVCCPDAVSYNKELEKLLGDYPQSSFAWSIDGDGSVSSYKADAPQPLSV